MILKAEAEGGRLHPGDPLSRAEPVLGRKRRRLNPNVSWARAHAMNFKVAVAPEEEIQKRDWTDQSVSTLPEFQDAHQFQPFTPPPILPIPQISAQRPHVLGAGRRSRRFTASRGRLGLPKGFGEDILSGDLLFYHVHSCSIHFGGLLYQDIKTLHESSWKIEPAWFDQHSKKPEVHRAFVQIFRQTFSQVARIRRVILMSMPCLGIAIGPRHGGQQVEFGI